MTTDAVNTLPVRKPIEAVSKVRTDPPIDPDQQPRRNRSRPRLPFGGVKRSGFGRELGAAGIREFTKRENDLDFMTPDAVNTLPVRKPIEAVSKVRTDPPIDPGPGVFKIDYALSEPVPWKAEACRRAGTIHLGGGIDEIAVAEREVSRGKIPERPFVLIAQQSLFDETRAPHDQHTLWAYCHVPFDCGTDVSDQIESQIERFAPGFRDCVLGRHTVAAADLGSSNPNLAGGDINGGAANLMQLIARPILSPEPYRTPLRGVYLCSASTSPGGGVHGMCGYHAARLVLREIFKRRGELSLI